MSSKKTSPCGPHNPSAPWEYSPADAQAPSGRKPLLDLIPAYGFVRLKQVIGDAKAHPPVPAIIPVSASTWWAGVMSGRFPRPVKLGPRTTAWRVEDIRALVANPEAR